MPVCSECGEECACPCCVPEVEYRPFIGPKTLAQHNQEEMIKAIYGPLLEQQLRTPIMRREL